MNTRILALAATALTLLLPFHARAQITGAESVQQLKEQVDALLERVRKLEERLDKPLTVKAPFIVTDAKGTPVMKVTRNAGAELSLGAQAPFRITEDGSTVNLSMRMGSSEAAMNVTAGRTYVWASGAPGRGARLYAEADKESVEAKNGSEVAQLAILNGSSRLKLWKGGKPFFFVNSDQKASLTLGDEGAPGLEATDDGNEALVVVKKGPARARILANSRDAAEVRVVGGSNREALMGADTVITGIQVHSDTGGEKSPEWIQLAMDAEEGPRLRIYDNSVKVADLGVALGKYPGLRIYDTDGKPTVHAGLGLDGTPSLSILNKDVVIGSLLRNTEGEGVLQLAQTSGGGKLAAELGRISSDKQVGLRIYDNAGDLVVGAGSDKNGVPSVRLVKKGRTRVDMAVDDGDIGRVSVYAATSESASLTTRNGAGLLEVNTADGELAAELGLGKSNNVALRFFGDDKQLLAAGIDSDGDGSIQVQGRAGKPVVGIGTNDGSDGFVTVYGSGGGPRAALATVKDEGYMQVFGTTNNIMASIGPGVSGGGKLQLLSAGGEPMVEAGTTKDNVGLVKAGPASRAQVGAMLGAPGSFIVGRSN